MKLEEMREAIKQNTKITEHLKDYLQKEPENGRIMCDCPFCKGANTFVASDRQNMYKCFSCNDENDLVAFVAKYQHVSMDTACQQIGEKIGIEYNSGYTKQQQDMFDANQKAGYFYHQALKANYAPQKYLQERGLTKATINRFGIGYADGKWDSCEKSLMRSGVNQDIMKAAGLVTVKENGRAFDRFRNRIMFPIFNLDNRIIGFGGRIIDNTNPDEAKYLNTATTPIFDKRSNLFALNLAKDSQRNAGREGLILCEGYMDVISLHQAGFDNAVASLGTAFTSEHAALLREYTDKVYLSFDNDQAGIRAKMKAIPILKNAGLEVSVLDVSPSKDPDEYIKSYGAKQFETVIQKAENSYSYELRQWMSPEVREWLRIDSSFYEKFTDVIAHVTPEEQRHYQAAYRSIIQHMEQEKTDTQAANEEQQQESTEKNVEKAPEHSSEPATKNILETVTDEYEIEPGD